MTPSLDILHTLCPAPFGGLEEVVHQLAHGQAERHRVTVLAIYGADGPSPYLDRFDAEAVDVRRLDIPGRGYLRERRAVTDILERGGYDVLHTHGYRPDVLHGGAARKAGIATVTTVHGFTGGDLKNRFYEWLQKRSYRRFDAVVAVSGAMVPLLVGAGVPRDRIHVVQNALTPPVTLRRPEAEERLGLDPGSFHIGWVGRLNHEKAPEVLLEALGLLPSHDGVTASFIGGGRMEEALRGRRDELGLEDCVVFHGPVPSASALLSAFDVVVLSSRTEGTPMVLLEAMGAGIPVVSTAVGGVPDVVSESEALLVPPDRPRDLAEAIVDVRENPERATERASAARRRFAEAFDVGAWVEAYDGVYQRARAVRSTPDSPLTSHSSGHA